MKNDAMFNMIKGSCTATAPEILSKLSFDAAAEYKDTVAAPSPKKSYIKAAVVYAAACLVIAVAIPFIIGNVSDKEPSVPSSSVAEKSINAEDINEIYNKVDPDTLPQEVTVEEVEKIIEAARRAYDDYNVVILSGGTKITTTPKKPDITEDDLEGMFYGDERILEYKEYFDNMNLIIYDAISARFSENSTCIIEPMDYTSPPYASFWVLDLEATAFTDSEIIEHLMFENGNENIRYFCDIIAYGLGNGEKYYFAHYTETLGEETMLFPTKEEYAILTAELPEASVDYKLAIEDEILAAESVRSKEDLIKRGYDDMTEQYGTKSVMDAFRCETGAALMYVYYDRGYKHPNHIYVNPISTPVGFADVKRVEIEIWTGFVLISIELNVEINDPIVLPPSIEKELRYILNMPYKLAIEDELLGAESSKTKDELIDYGYEEVTHGGDTFLLREFECETGTAHFRIFNRELHITAHPYVDAFDAHIPDLEDGKIYLTADIWTGNCFIKMRVIVDDAFPIVLPEAVEAELRYILNIEKEDHITDPPVEGIIADDIRYLDSDVGYKFAIIERDGKFGLINTDGEIILPVEYKSIDLNFLAPNDMRMKLQAVISSETKYEIYWIENDGTLTEVPLYGFGAEGGIEIYWMNGKPLMLDFFEGEIEYSVDRYTSDMVYKFSYAVASGKQSDVIPIREINSYISDNGWYYVREENLVSHKYALYNFRTKELITDFIFDDCGYDDRRNQGFVEGILAVKKDGKWGYVNESGEMITDFIYDASETKEINGNIVETMYYTLNGYTIVRQGDLFGLIYKNGELVLDVMYEDISNVNPDGYVWVKTNGRWTVIKIS
ncbi:MAG: WG repeat-containing protein [Ruminococcaceae bacterium]|nr:WG repeat-containing protein [Oscillospiraceae bacterium]